MLQVTTDESAGSTGRPTTTAWRILPVLLMAVAATMVALAGVTDARAQAGVLVPSSVSDTPDAKILELTEMQVGVTIDRQIARTRVMQIFANRTGQPVEGTYVFAIPTTASIADFAVWDGDVRIPGVILEKRKAKSLYEDIAAQAIDPGLLEQEDEDQSTTAFTVRVAPVPAYGTKRIEIEYTELIPIDNLESYYSFPLKPSEYGVQNIRHLRLDVLVTSGFALSGFNVRGTQFPLAFDRQETNAIAGHYDSTDVSPGEDFSFIFGVAVPKSELDVVAYRAPERISADELRDPALAERQPDGYFEASAVLNQAGAAPGATRANDKPRSVLIALDTSLSMSGEKLDRAFQALQYFLGALTPADKFNMVLFNDDVVPMGNDPVAATPDQIERALAFVRAGYLSGGTDLQGALGRIAELSARLPDADGGRAIVLITDGNPTLTTTQTKRILEAFNASNAAGPRARLDVFGIGSDTRVGLLSELSKSSRGLFVWARETEDIEFKLKAFFSKVGRAPVDGIALASDGGDIYQVYPDTSVVGYDGSAVQYFGRYRRPGHASFTVTGSSPAGRLNLSTAIDLPERDETHADVPRFWARARVDYLLAQIDLNGETDEAINEIIALSKRYKFVTPYTSFLAAPRSLLRPRTIRPGDPVLRVQADESITSIVAVFPFGLVKPLRKASEPGLWETRFLAPVDMDDGTYGCRLVMTDSLGRTIEEVKHFRIDSRPPTLAARVEPAAVHAGEDASIVVDAPADTRWIAARLFGASPVRVAWNAEQKSNRGVLHIPEGLPPGVYTVSVAAEDFAHNGATAEARIEVLGR